VAQFSVAAGGYLVQVRFGPRATIPRRIASQLVAHAALGNYLSRRYSTAPVRNPRKLAGFPARFLAPIAI
jgi:hypothetical protein